MIKEHCNMLPQVHIELLKYPPSMVNNSPTNKIENSSFKSHDNVGKMIDVCKLLSQLLNAKVVVEKLQEPLGKSSRPLPLARTVSDRTKTDLNKEQDLPGETKRKGYRRLYCAKCKKTVFAREGDSKNCSKCKTEMTYLCTKCNVKHYQRYPFFKSHWNRCNGNGRSDHITDDVDLSESNVEDTSKTADSLEQMDENDKNESNIKDTSIEEARIDSSLSLNKNKFILKKIQDVNLVDNYYRYCSECDLVTKNVSRCSKCDKKLFYVCKKCKSKYIAYASLFCHMQSRCYPDNEYRCTHCQYTAFEWAGMCKHFKRMHTIRPVFKCEHCSFATKYKQSLIRHLEIGNHDKIIERTNGVEQTNKNVKDTATLDTVIDSSSASDKDHFILKQNQDVNLSEEYNRYCPECDMVITSNVKRCNKCDVHLEFACKKCNAKYKFSSSMLYHMRSQCYRSTEYQCKYCKYSTTDAATIRRHFKDKHTKRTLLKCKLCSYESKYKQNWKKHVATFDHSNMIDRTNKVGKIKSNIKDKDTSGGHVNLRLALKKDKFVVKYTRSENLMKGYDRYCPECELVITTGNTNKCNKCDKHLHYKCKKCKAKYSSNTGMWYHLKSQCFPTNEYRCTNCKFTAKTWTIMLNHFQNTHYEVDLKFRCRICKYSTNFRQHLGRHHKLCH